MNFLSSLERYYSIYSTIFLILRTICLLFCGSSVNDKSKETLKVLREFSNKSFSILDVSSPCTQNNLLKLDDFIFRFFISLKSSFSVVPENVGCPSVEPSCVIRLSVFSHHKRNYFVGEWDKVYISEILFVECKQKLFETIHCYLIL